MNRIKIIIVDDHQLFRNGLKFILSQNPSFEVIAEASNGKEFLDILNNLMPDIVLMDINMPVMNGIDATAKAMARYPELKILVLSMLGDEEYYNNMIDLGAKGFVLKDTDNEELITAIEKIAQGHNYFSQELLINLIRNKSSETTIELTLREKEILQLICKGMSTSEIADSLHISIRTVERHKSNLLEKTNTSSSIKLVIFALKNNLVKIE